MPVVMTSSPGVNGSIDPSESSSSSSGTTLYRVLLCFILSSAGLLLVFGVTASLRLTCMRHACTIEQVCRFGGVMSMSYSMADLNPDLISWCELTRRLDSRSAA